MNRRQFLTSTGITVTAVLAGCIVNDPDDATGDDSPGDDSESDDEGSTGDDGNGSADEFHRYVSLAAIDEVPESVPVEFGLQVTNNSVIAEGTAVLEVTATNTGTTEMRVPSPYYKGTSDTERGLLVYSLEAPDSPDRGYTPDCIEDPSASQEYAETTDEGPLGYELEPGESGTDELLVVDDPSVDGCFSPGNYRFESTHTVADTEFAWGFTLEITEEEPGGNDPGESEDRRYEECPREIIPYDQFPEDVQAEIDGALDGDYEADRVYLRETMDLNESYVSVEDSYYEASVSVESGSETLSLDLVQPRSMPRSRPVSVEHERDGNLTITVKIVADDGTVLLKKTRDMWAGGEVEFGRISRYGTHDLHLTVAEGDTIQDEVTKSVVVNESHFETIVLIEQDDISVTGAVAELGVCQFEE